MRIIPGTLAALAILALAGCGPDDNKTPLSGIISGVAATGEAISGSTVTLKCAGGLASSTATTRHDGYYQFDVSAITLPCLVQVSHTDDADIVHTLHALVSGTGTTNITPLSELLLATLLGTPSLEPAFARFYNTPLRTFSRSEQADALEILASRLQALGMTLPVGMDPVRDILIAKTLSQDGNALDALLDEIGLLMQEQGINQFQLNLGIVLDLPVNITRSFSSWAPTAEAAVFASPAKSLAGYGMAAQHEGTLEGTDTPCSFSVDSEGNITANFMPAHQAASLYAQQRPHADGLSINLNGPHTIPNINITFDDEYDLLESYIWSFVDDGNAFGMAEETSDFFAMTGASGAAVLSLRYIVQENTPEAGVATAHRELQFAVATSALSQSGSATCITPTHTIPMTISD